jgi:hypothetical protein
VQTYRCLGGTFCSHVQGRIKATSLMTEDVEVNIMYCQELFVRLHCVRHHSAASALDDRQRGGESGVSISGSYVLQKGTGSGCLPE